MYSYYPIKSLALQHHKLISAEDIKVSQSKPQRYRSTYICTVITSTNTDDILFLNC